jgi:hypothetical protein
MELYFVINSHLKVQTSQVVNLDLTALSNEMTYVAAVVVLLHHAVKLVYTLRGK